MKANKPDEPYVISIVNTLTSYSDLINRESFTLSNNKHQTSVINDTNQTILGNFNDST